MSESLITQYFETQQDIPKRRLFLAMLEAGADYRIIDADLHIIECTINGLSRIFMDEVYILNNITGSRLTRNKQVTRVILHDAGILVPAGFILPTNPQDIHAMTQRIVELFPAVVKPVDGRHGIGVFMQINTMQEVQAAMHNISKDLAAADPSGIEFEKDIIIEKQFSGSDYRVLVLDGAVIACAERIPGHVIGDGAHTIQQLVDLFNMNRLPGTELYRDVEADAVLHRANRSWEDVPAPDEVITLRDKANLSAGGICVNRTDVISQRFQDICIRVAEVLDLKFAGIDILTPDISSNNSTDTYAIIEVNSRPDYYGHEEPYAQGHTDTTGILTQYIMNHFDQ